MTRARYDVADCACGRKCYVRRDALIAGAKPICKDCEMRERAQQRRAPNDRAQRGAPERK